MKEQWIEDIRRKMQDHTEPAPEGLWDDIQNAMGKQPKVLIPRRKKLAWYAIGVGSIAAMMALLFGIWQKNVVEDSSLNRLAQSEQELTESLLQEPTGSTSILNDAATEPIRKVPTSSKIPHYQEPLPFRSEEDGTIDDNGPENNDASAKTEETEDIQNKKTEEKEGFRPLTGIPEENTSDYQSTGARSNAIRRDEYREYRSKGKITLGILAANLTNDIRHANGYGEFMKGATLPSQLSTCDNGNTPGTEILFENIGKDPKTEKKHRQPVKVGVSVRYQFNRWFGLESGLVYSHLASELSTGYQGNYFHTDQTLQYLGIPLMASGSFWNNDRFNFYLSAGGMIEKCIAGKSDTQYVLNYEQTSSAQKHIMEKQCQFSVNGSIGVQVNIISSLGIFVEPGISYYFDNGSPIENIYKSKPLNFSLNLGVRFNL